MTPQQIEALKLALEALDIAQGMLADLRSQHQPKMLSAYTALEEVLAEHAMCEVQRLGQEIEQKIDCVNHDCDQCKAQPEQEPVAVYGYCPECGAKGVMRERRPDGNDKCAKGHTYPSSKATTPPQRTWVGLTDEEIDKWTPEIHSVIRGIEAKLKELNT